MIPRIQKLTKTHLIALLLTVAAVILFSNRSCNQSNTSDNLDSLTPVKFQEDANGKLISIIKSQEIALSSRERLIDSLSRALKIKSSEVTSVDRYLLKTDTVIVRDIVYQRSDDSVIIAKNDGYLKLKAVGLTSGQSYISLQHTDTIWRIGRTVKPLFKPSYTEIYLRSASPYNKINQGSSFVVKSPRPIVSIGPSLGFDPIGRKITFQIGVQYNVINIYGKK